jgi:hypothetical protein
MRHVANELRMIDEISLGNGLRIYGQYKSSYADFCIFDDKKWMCLRNPMRQRAVSVVPLRALQASRSDWLVYLCGCRPRGQRMDLRCPRRQNDIW